MKKMVSHITTEIAGEICIVKDAAGETLLEVVGDKVWWGRDTLASSDEEFVKNYNRSHPETDEKAFRNARIIGLVCAALLLLVLLSGHLPGPTIVEPIWAGWFK